MSALSDPFPGDWYAESDRPSSPPAWQIGRAIAFDAARIRSPRPLHPEAVALLARYDRLGFLEAWGGVEGVVDISEAAHWIDCMMEKWAALFAIGQGGA